MKVKWTIEIEFDTEMSYDLETEDPGITGGMYFEEDGIYGYNHTPAYPWKVIKKEINKP